MRLVADVRGRECIIKHGVLQPLSCIMVAEFLLQQARVKGKTVQGSPPLASVCPPGTDDVGSVDTV